jgi:drug/metabolite transporter (DMT)-like permease
VTTAEAAPADASAPPAATGVHYGAVAIAVFAWGCGPLAVRAVTASGLTVAFWRLWIAVPITWLVSSVVARQPVTRQVLRVSAPAGALFGAGLAVGFAAFKATSIANATLISSLQPLLVLVVAGPLFGERITRRKLGAAAVSLAGVTLVILGATATSGASLRGDLLAVVNLVGYTAYFLEVKRRRNAGVPSWAFLTAMVLWAAITITPIALLWSSDLDAVGGWDWFWLLVMVLLPGLAGHGLMTWAQRYVDVTVSSLLTLGSPVVSVIGAWIFFDQELVPLQILGAALVLAGLAGLVLGQGSRVRAAPVAPEPTASPS